MSGVERFEDLTAWQKARLFTKAVYLLTKTSHLSNDFGLCDQMRRAAVSVMANIAEGFERHSPADFHHFLVIAKASCAESRSHLYVALDAGYISEPEFKAHMEQANDLARTLNALRNAVDRNRQR